MIKLFDDPPELAERAYYTVLHYAHRSAQVARWTLARETLAKCRDCGAAAVWRYMSAGPRSDYCDDCVPRGCECNIIDSSIIGEAVAEPPDANGVVRVRTDFGGVEPEQHRDDRGRLLPCCEFFFDRLGWPR